LVVSGRDADEADKEDASEEGQGTRHGNQNVVQNSSENRRGFSVQSRSICLVLVL
jgi:hypothetical protein